MKRKYIAVLTVLGAAMTSTPAQADTSKHLRILIHGTRAVTPIDAVGTATVGLSGWVIAPSVADAANKWVVLLGGSIDAFNARLELHAGTLLLSGVNNAIIDARLSLGPSLWGGPISSWTSGQYIVNTDGAGSGYLYTELDTTWLAPIVVGVETENIFLPGADSNAIGAHVKMVLDTMILMIAYQQHVTIPTSETNRNQIWFRVVLNF